MDGTRTRISDQERAIELSKSRVESSIYKWRWEDAYEYEIEKCCNETDDTEM
jgi:hypothetical protein